MKDLLNYLLNNIIDHPEAIKIEEITDETGTIVFKVEVHPEDVGKVIGKKGKIINSIRNLIRVKAVKLQQRVRVEVVNPPLQNQVPTPEHPAMEDQPATISPVEPQPLTVSAVDKIVGSEETPAPPEPAKPVDEAPVPAEPAVNTEKPKATPAE
ncbi:KH domain-containing protein [Patescibacteria group bacterium]|nr:KH domain-containing protein [Patescibacteria group bacterium]MBU1931724.1 KH domain-containing protein [Patescibacteria group bacterium]